MELKSLCFLTLKMDDFNPGEKLKILLMELIPNDEGFLDRVDDFAIADGELSSLIYESTINYLVRCLITSAVYLERKLEQGNDSLFLVPQ